MVKKRSDDGKGLAGGFDQKYPPHSLLAKLVGRLMRLSSYYTNLALKEMGIGGLDEFTYLLSVQQLKQPRKTEIIYQNFHELSSGLLIIDRLKNKGLLTEMADEKDKRSRLLKLTAEGEKKLSEAQIQLLKVSGMFYNLMPENDIEQCIRLLSPVELIYAGLWQQHKGHIFDDIYREVKGGDR